MLTFALFVAVMAGCSQSADKPEPVNNGASESTSDVANEVVSEAAAETPIWPIVYTDSQDNEVTITEEPQRIVSLLHAMYPDYLYALDAYPVGSALADNLLSQWDAYASFVAEQPVVDIGAPNAPNLELLLEMNPDLIIGYEAHNAQYDELSQIAPTVILNYAQINDDWKYGIAQFAELLGKSEHIDDVIANTEQAVADAAARLADFRAKGESVMFVSMVDKTIWPYTVEQLQTVYSTDHGLGLAAPAGYEQVTDRSTALSFEAFIDFNPDHLFLMVDPGDSTTQEWLEELQNSPLWTGVSAVQQNHLYLTDRSIFAFNAPIATQYGAEFVSTTLTADE